MIRKLFISLTAMLAFAISARAYSVTYYSELTVYNGENQNGKVYVSKENSANIQYDDEKSTDKQSSEESYTLSKPNSLNHTYYIYAQAPEDMVLDYWSTNKNGSTRDVEASVQTYTIAANSENEKSPTHKDLYAFFKERPPVIVSVNNPLYGTVSLTGTNQEGGSVTVTTKKYLNSALKNNNYSLDKAAKEIRFKGWYIGEECVSTNMSYTFKVSGKTDIEARYVWDKSIKSYDGFYRVYNYYATESTNENDVMSIIGGYGSEFTRTRNTKGVIELLYPASERFHNPATIIRISGDSKSDYTDCSDFEYEKTVLKNAKIGAQGTSSDVVMGGYKFEMRMASQPGYYKFVYSNLNLRQANGYHNHERPWETTHNQKLYYELSADDAGKPQDIMSYFELEPIDKEHIDEFYFGAKPSKDMEYDDAYWTSMYTAFAYECRDGVEAYYISEIDDEFTNERIAVLKRIEDDIVPAYTPVLLKCTSKSEDPKNNRLLPLTDDHGGSADEPAFADNMLKGEFQLAMEANNPGYTKFEGSKMRVFSVGSNGVVGFYKLEEGTTLAANRAWLDISELTADALSKPIVIRMDYSGVEDVIVEESTADDPDAPMYNMMGQRIVNPAPGQIYIQNGRKYIAR